MSFYVTGYDPGTKAGAVVTIDLGTFRVIEGTPVSLAELKKGGKKPQVEPTYDELSHCLRELARGSNHRRFFQRVVIEKQMKSGKLQSVVVALSTLLGNRAVMSSMRSVRSHYGISVSERDMNARSKRARADMAYRKRKKLSIQMVEEAEISPIHEDDLENLFVVASEYWESRAEEYGFKSTGDLNRNIRKAYSDLVEAAVHALFPGNWGNYVESEIGLHEVEAPKFSENLTRAHKQRAKLLLNIFGLCWDKAEPKFLPLSALKKYSTFANGDGRLPSEKKQNSKKKKRQTSVRPSVLTSALTIPSAKPQPYRRPSSLFEVTR